jgi:outer membrane protein TolC
LDVGISKFFPFGTDVAAELSINQTDSARYGDQYESRIGFSVTQAILQGRGRDVNLANLRQVRLDTRISNYELRGFSETLLAQVEEAYWDYALARRQIETVQESLRLAEQQKAETEEMISVGTMAETELVAAQAEIAFRMQELINAKSTTEKRRLALLRLLNPPGENLWQREVVLLHHPSLSEVNLDDIETHVSVALRMRPDLNQARLELERGDLEVIKTKNGLLPRMDFFIDLGKTGYADSFGGSVSDITGEGYDFQVGINFEHPLGGRGPKARDERAMMSRDQAEKAVSNLSQLIEMDVRTAYIEVNRAEQQISATAETRKLQEEKLRVETEKFRVGRSTNFMIAQAQRDLVASQIEENRAVVNYLKALIDLYRLEGSLLERRGISIQD